MNFSTLMAYTAVKPITKTAKSKISFQILWDQACVWFSLH